MDFFGLFRAALEEFTWALLQLEKWRCHSRKLTSNVLYSKLHAVRCTPSRCALHSDVKHSNNSNLRIRFECKKSKWEKYNDESSMGQMTCKRVQIQYHCHLTDLIVFLSHQRSGITAWLPSGYSQKWPMFGRKWSMFELKQPMFHRIIRLPSSGQS